LIGFVVKADSEFRPGPNRYGRDHAEGANMLARALAPHGGLLFWRAFVYNCRQDWRDAATDRPKAAYETYAPLEGRFDANVVLQIKYGPYDFQPREPVSPLFYAMPTTRKLLELQITQEYTGQQIDLYYLLPLWQDIRAALPSRMPALVGAVPNVGDDANWTGHDLAQANWFAYGLFAWYGDVDARAVAALWARLTFGDDPVVIETIAQMLLDSRTIFENYTSPLGLGWMVTPHTHYGPSPEGYEYDLWGTYLRANREAIGIDRSARGTGFTAQYPPQWAALFDDPAACPLPLLLFFHRLPYDHRLPGGETLVQHVYNTHFEGAAQAEALLKRWRALEGRVPGACFDRVQARLIRQIQNAREWRDVVNTYFYRYSGIPDAQGRKIFP
jgi:alpha-glucuronidase